MRGRDELISILACLPVDMEALGIPDDADDATDEQREAFNNVFRQWWTNEDVDYDALIDFASASGLADYKTCMAGIAVTPEEAEDIIGTFVAAHLSGLMVGWMMARDMGLKED